MKIHRIEISDYNLLNEYQWVPMRLWLNQNIGVYYFSIQYLDEGQLPGESNWLFSFLYEEDKVKFILKWM